MGELSGLTHRERKGWEIQKRAQETYRIHCWVKSRASIILSPLKIESHLFSCHCTDFSKQISKAHVSKEKKKCTNNTQLRWRLFCFIYSFYLSRGCCWSFSSRTTDGWSVWGTAGGMPTVTFRSGDRNAGYSIGCGVITFLQRWL